MKDPNLRRCSKAARGVWIDMLCLMFECSARGVLSTGGAPWSDEDIATAVGGDTAEVLTCITELLLKGVAHRNSAGAIFCKRMARDEEQRRQTRDRVNKHRNQGKKSVRPVTLVKRKCNAGSSASSSSSSSTLNTSESREVSSTLSEHTHSPPAQQNGVCVSKSKFSLAENQEYAWAAYHAGYGVKQPDAWAAANFTTGKYDEMVTKFRADPQAYFPSEKFG